MAVVLVLVPCLWICLVSSGYCLDKAEDSRLADLEERFTVIARHVEQLEKRDTLNEAKLRAQQQRIDELERLVLRQETSEQDEAEEHNKQTGVENEPAANREDEGKPGDIQTGGITRQRTRRQGNGQTVAFYAELSSSIIHQNAGPNETIIFDHVITNVGRAYSNTLGTFVAPVPGLYVFSVSLMAYISETEYYYLSKNSQPIAYMYVQASKSPYMNTGHTAILHMAKGDNVEIHFRDADGSLHGNQFSGFSGFLLQQDFDAGTVVG